RPAIDSTPSASSASAPSAVAVGSASGTQASIEELLSVVSRDRQVLAAHLRQAQRLEVEDGRLVVYHDPGDDWLGPALQRSGNRTTLDSALVEVYGPGTTWTLRDGEPIADEEEGDGEVEEPQDHDATVQSVLQIFDGTVDRTIPNS
ncbi:MAG: hypothetical protein K8H90_05355, partial [Thermoanaerobaculia bacterium]|nr:hypothetical protein [Thermoanaerobaculia bacterium]